MEKDEKKVLLSLTRTSEGVIAELKCDGLVELGMVAGCILKLMRENSTLRDVTERFLDKFLLDDALKTEQQIPTVISYTQNEYKN